MSSIVNDNIQKFNPLCVNEEAPVNEVTTIHIYGLKHFRAVLQHNTIMNINY